MSVRVGGAGSCCKLPTLNYKFDVADDDIEMEALLGEQAEFKGQVRRLSCCCSCPCCSCPCICPCFCSG